MLHFFIKFPYAYHDRQFSSQQILELGNTKPSKQIANAYFHLFMIISGHFNTAETMLDQTSPSHNLKRQSLFSQ